MSPGTAVPAEALLNIDCADSIAKTAKRITPGQAAQALQAIGRTVTALDQNANARLAFDALLLQLPPAVRIGLDQQAILRGP